MYDPLLANFITWWPLYRVGDTVFVQNHLLFVNTLNMPFNVDALQDFVRPRRTINEEGAVISEWPVALSAVEAFAKTF